MRGRRDGSEFEAERSRLTGLAYRLCGSWADAEDVVQQVAVEWVRASDRPASTGGWLTTVTVRRTLDRVRTRRHVGDYPGPWLPEPLVEPFVEAWREQPDVAAERLDTLSIGFGMLAEHLTPPQRAVVVLRALDHSHAEIAGILGITPAAARQHHARGTRRLAELDGRGVGHDGGSGGVLASGRRVGAEADGASASALLRTFLAAAREGDVEALEALLHEDVRAFQDGGGRTRAARRVLIGVSNIARFALGVARLHEHRHTARFVAVNGAPGALLTLGDTVHVLSVQVRERRLHRIYDVCNPDKLRGPDVAVRADASVRGRGGRG